MHEENAKVSVIMPAYNSEKYVAEAIESVIRQTYTNWELLAIDDGSRDTTGKIMDAYAAKDVRIKVFHTENRGVSHARNVGLDHADGEWVAFLDSDDILMADALVNLLSVAENKDIVIGNYYEFPPMKQRMYLTDRDNINSKELLLSVSLIGGAAWGMIFRKNAIQGQFPCDLQYGEDALFLYNQIRHCNHISTIHNIVYKYRRGNQQTLSHQMQNMVLFYVERLCSLAGDILDGKDEYYAFTAHTFVSYIKTIADTDKLTKTEKIDRIKEALKSKYFCEIPLTQLKLIPKEMHRFVILKAGNMEWIEKEFQLE